MTKETAPDYSHLLELHAEPELFDPDDMPEGREYLHSSAKTALDTVLGLSILPLAMPAALLGASAVKLVDGSKPIFRQTRAGHLGHLFTIYKLRTMPNTADDTHSNGHYDDPRRSTIGKALSLLRIDEAPQLANVARRDMSVIGPRPLLPDYLKDVRHKIGNKKADEWIKIRSLALPGLFDDFGVMYHGHRVQGEPDEQLLLRIAVESAYILENASMKEDLRILADTFRLLGQTAVSHATSAVQSTLLRLRNGSEQA